MLGRKFCLHGKIAAVALAILLSACTDLSAVRDWATTSMQAAQFNGIVATYADTPTRIAYYDPGGAASWQAQARTRAQQAAALEQQLGLVEDYMAALAALSDDRVTNYDEDVDALTNSLKETGQVSETTLGAAGKLVRTLLNAAASFAQKRKVGELIEEANPPLQNILTGELRTIVNQDFRRDLDVERAVLEDHFKKLLRQGGGSATANAALNEWYTLRTAENARRRAAIDSYLRVLDSIARGHQALFDKRDDLDEVQLAKDLFKLAKGIRGSIKEIIKT